MGSVNESAVAGTVNIDQQGQYNATLPTLVDGEDSELQVDVRGRLIVVEQNSAAILAAVDQLEGYLDQLEGYLDGVEGSLTTIAGKDFATQTTLAAILAAVDQLEGYTDQLEGYLDGVEGSLTTIAGKDFATQTTLASILAAVDQLEGYTDQLEGYLDGVEGSLTTIAGKDFATQTTLAAVLAAVDQLEGYTDQLEGYLDGVEASLTTIAAGAKPYLSVVDQIDTSPGPVINAASQTIQDNAGVFVVAVASLAANTKRIRATNTTGYFIGVYVGPNASEVLAFIVSPGTDNEIEHTIAAAARITIRNMDTNDIVEGQFMLQFLG